MGNYYVSRMDEREDGAWHVLPVERSQTELKTGFSPATRKKLNILVLLERSQRTAITEFVGKYVI